MSLLNRNVFEVCVVLSLSVGGSDFLTNVVGGLDTLTNVGGGSDTLTTARWVTRPQ